MKVIYFSPHLDDAIFSCGGIIAHQVSEGRIVEIWSFFTADPPVENLTPFARILHQRWGKRGNPYKQRRDEDDAACRFIGVKNHHFGFLDCIYRRFQSDNSPLVRKTGDLFRPTSEAETVIEVEIWREIQSHISTGDIVILPLGAGGHIDHSLIRRVGCRLENHKFFYPDFPYSGKLASVTQLNLPKEASGNRFSLTPEELAVWQHAAGRYQTQISSFWNSKDALYSDIEHYASSPIGSTLWVLPDYK